MLKKIKMVTYVQYLIVVAISLVLLLLLNNLGDGQVKFLLDFYKTTVEIFFGNSHYYNEEQMLYYGYDYIIGAKCLGLNMIVLVFAVCSLVGASKLDGGAVWKWWGVSALFAIVASVFANVLRLLSSIYFVSYMQFETIHALLGIVIYLSALIFSYWLSIKMLEKHEGGEDNGKNIQTNL